MSSYPGPGTPGYPQQPYPEYPPSPYPTQSGTYPPPPPPPPTGYPPAAQPMYPYAPAPAPMPGYYPGPMAPANNGYAIASLICSIGGWTFIPVIGWIVGIILGVVALNQIRASAGTQEGRGLAVAGLIIGIFGLALGLLACVVFAVIAATVPGYQYQ